MTDSTASGIIDIEINTGGAAQQLQQLQRQINSFNLALNSANQYHAKFASDYAKELQLAINKTGAFTAETIKLSTAAQTLDKNLSRGKSTLGQFFSAKFNKDSAAAAEVMALAADRAARMQTQFIATSGAAKGMQDALAIRPLAAFSSEAAIASEKSAILSTMLKQGTTQLINFGKNVQWAGRQLMVGFTVPLTIFGNTASKTFMELERQVVSFKKVYGDAFTTTADVNKNLAAVQDLAKEYTKYGIAVKDTIGLAAQAAAAGRQNKDLTDSVAQATRLATLGQMDQNDALQTTISLQSAFKLSGKDLADTINFLNMVENQTVVSLQDISAAIPRVAPVIQGLGGDVKDLTVFLAAMQEGGVGAEEGANALKSGLASLINPTKQAQQALKGLGIDINAIVTTNKGDLMGTVTAFSKALQSLDQFQRQQALEQVFGKFQYAKLGALFENITRQGSQAQQVIATMGYSTEQLAKTADKELQTVADSFGVQLTGAVERFKLSIAPIGKMFVEIAIPIINFITSIVDKFNGLSEGQKKFIAIATVITGVVIPAATMFLGLLMNLTGTLAKFVQGFGAFAKGLVTGGPLGAIKALTQSSKYLSNAELDAALAAQQLSDSSQDVTTALIEQASSAGIATTAIQNLAAAYQALVMTQAEAAQFSTFAIPSAAAAEAKKTPTRRQRRNKGGMIFMSNGSTVPGTGNTDIVPAMLTPGEFVVNKEATKNNLGILKAINGGEIRGYNNGDIVTSLWRTFNPSRYGIEEVPQLQSKKPSQLSSQIRQPKVYSPEERAAAARGRSTFAHMQRPLVGNGGIIPEGPQFIEIFDQIRSSADLTDLEKAYLDILQPSGYAGSRIVGNLGFDISSYLNSGVNSIDNLIFDLEERRSLGKNPYGQMLRAIGIPEGDMARVSDRVHQRVLMRLKAMQRAGITTFIDRDLYKSMESIVPIALKNSGVTEDAALRLFTASSIADAKAIRLGGMNQAVVGAASRAGLDIRRIGNTKYYKGKGIPSGTKGLSVRGTNFGASKIAGKGKIGSLLQLISQIGINPKNFKAKGGAIGAASFTKEQLKAIRAWQENPNIFRAMRPGKDGKPIRNKDFNKESLWTLLSSIGKSGSGISARRATTLSPNASSEISKEDASFIISALESGRYDDLFGRQLNFKGLASFAQNTGGPNPYGFLGIDRFHTANSKKGTSLFFDLLTGQKTRGRDISGKALGDWATLLNELLTYRLSSTISGVSSDIKTRKPIIHLQGMQRGGAVFMSNGTTVPGVGNTDTVPAMLTPGEFVVNKESTKQNLGLLHAINGTKGMKMNRGGGVRKYAVGGLVANLLPLLLSGAGMATGNDMLMNAGFLSGMIPLGRGIKSGALKERFGSAKQTYGYSRTMGGADGGSAGVIKSLGSAVKTLIPGITKARFAFGGLATLAIAAGVEMYKWNKGVTEAQQAGAKLTKAMYGSAEKTQKMAEFFGRQTFAQQAAIASVEKAAGSKVSQEAQQAGTGFVKSDAGQQMLADVSRVRSAGGDAATALRNQLASGIIAGAITPEEANAIAAEIGTALGDQNLAINVAGKLTELLGPDGRDVLKNLSAITAEISPKIDQTKLAKDAQDAYDKLSLGEKFMNLFRGGEDGFINAQEAKTISAQVAAVYEKERDALALLNLAYQNGTITLDEYNQKKKDITNTAGVTLDDAAKAQGYESYQDLLDTASASGEGPSVTGPQGRRGGKVKRTKTRSDKQEKAYQYVEAQKKSAEDYLLNTVGVRPEDLDAVMKKLEEIGNSSFGLLLSGKLQVSDLDIMTRLKGSFKTVAEMEEFLDKLHTIQSIPNIDKIIAFNVANKDDVEQLYEDYMALEKEPDVWKGINIKDNYSDTLAKFGVDYTWLKNLPNIEKVAILRNITTYETLTADNTVKGGPGAKRTLEAVTSALNSTINSLKNPTTPKRPPSPKNPSSPGGTTTADKKKNLMNRFDLRDKALDLESKKYSEIIRKIERQNELDQRGLDLLARKEDQINKIYDDRLEALDKVEQANERIAQQEQDRIGLAQAISSGDIAGAAQAAMQIAQNERQNALQDARATLEEQRQNALKTLTVEINGEMLTREQIEERMYQRSLEANKAQDELYKIEEKRRLNAEAREKIETRLYLLEQKKYIEELKALKRKGKLTTAEKRDLKDLIASYNLLVGDYNTTYGGSIGTLWHGGKVVHMATGSIVPGFGSSDTTPAMLTPGEFVVRKQVAQAWMPILEAINRNMLPSLNTPSFNVPEYNNTTVKDSTHNGATVYNDYQINVNVDGTNASPQDIANVVLETISKYNRSNANVRGVRMNG